MDGWRLQNNNGRLSSTNVQEIRRRLGVPVKMACFIVLLLLWRDVAMRDKLRGFRQATDRQRERKKKWRVGVPTEFLLSIIHARLLAILLATLQTLQVIQLNGHENYLFTN